MNFYCEYSLINALIFASKNFLCVNMCQCTFSLLAIVQNLFSPKFRTTRTRSCSQKLYQPRCHQHISQQVQAVVWRHQLQSFRQPLFTFQHCIKVVSKLWPADSSAPSKTTSAGLSLAGLVMWRVIAYNPRDQRFHSCSIQLETKLFGGCFELYEIIHNAYGIATKSHVV